MSNKRKKEKLKKARNQELQTRLDMAPEFLMADGLRALDEGNARKAIDLLKLAGKKTGMTNAVKTALFRAYAIRTEQLQEKGMHQEAAIVKKMMAEFRPAATGITPETLASYIHHLSDKDAIGVYKDYSSAKGKLPEVEELLAGRIFVNRTWEYLNILPSDAPLRQNLSNLQEAEHLMDQGDWEKALSVLKPVPRSSPFAPVKLVAKAMVSFYADDDDTLKKALTLFPKGYPLEKALAALVLNDSKMEGGGLKPSSAQGLLWEGPFQVKERIDALTKAVSSMKAAEITRAAKGLSEILFPDAPLSAMIHIADLIMTHMMKKEYFDRETHAIIRQMLPEPHATILAAKANFLSPLNTFTAADSYFSLLAKEFPEESELKIAKSLLLHETLKKLLRSRHVLEQEFESYRYQNRQSKLGITSDNLPDAMIDMAKHGILLDPENKEGYDLLVQLPRKSRYAKNHVEELLQVMTKKFPNDPYPYLKLADLYHEKNAFRKAEQALATAIAIAPHDQRVIDRHVAALLVAADKNIQKGFGHLVVQDLEKAAAFGSKKLTPFLAEKKALVLMLNADASSLETVVQKSFEGLTGPLKIKALIALWIDLLKHQIHAPLYIKAAIAAFPREATLKEISSPDILSLLLPLEEMVQRLYPSRKPISVMISCYKDILGRLNNADLIRLIESDFSIEFYDAFQKELKRRAKKASVYEKGIFDFCLMVIRYSQENLFGSSLFRKILENADPELTHALRNLAGKLSLYVTKPSLKEALRSFRFEFLDDFGMPYRLPEDDLFDDGPDMFDMDSDSEMLDNMPDEIFDTFSKIVPKKLLKKFKNDIERSIDEMRLRNAPEQVIRAAGKQLKEGPSQPPMISIMLKVIKNHSIFHEFSKEALILLNAMS